MHSQETTDASHEHHDQKPGEGLEGKLQRAGRSVVLAHGCLWFGLALTLVAGCLVGVAAILF